MVTHMSEPYWWTSKERVIKYKPGCVTASSSSHSAGFGSSPPLPPPETPDHEGSPPTLASLRADELSSPRLRRTAPSLRGVALLKYSSPRRAGGREQLEKMHQALLPKWNNLLSTTDNMITCWCFLSISTISFSTLSCLSFTFTSSSSLACSSSSCLVTCSRGFTWERWKKRI